MNNCVKTKRAPTPILLKVSQEARYEELRHYSTPCTKKCFHLYEPESALHEFYFDPTVDTVVISDFDELRQWQYCRESGKAFKGESLDSIRFLEIGRKDWTHAEDNTYFWKNFTLAHSATLASWVPLKDWVQVFRHFKGLEELTVRGGGGGLSKPVDVKDCVEGLTDLYRELKAEYPVSKVPRVKIRPTCHKLGAERCVDCWHGLASEEALCWLLSKHWRRYGHLG